MKILFAGTPDFAVPPLQALINSPHEVCAIVTQPDRPAGRGQKLHSSPVKQCAEQHAIPIHQPSSMKENHIQQIIADYDADVMVVVAYGLILPQSVLSLPRLGCINIHASLLPRWRGAAPIQRAILAGDEQTGISIMQMEKGLDTGPILLQVTCSIEEVDTTATLQNKLATLGASAIISTLKDLSENNAHPIPQDERYVTYAEKIKKEEAALNWTLSAVELARQVRAFNPWPIAFSHRHNVLIHIWSAQAIEETHSDTPGSIISKGSTGIDVATGEGILRIKQLQLPGKRPQMVSDFMNAQGRSWEVGECLS